VQALAPTACTTIEEVGSTGVGALTLGFLALAVSTVVMVAKAASADAERRKYYFCNTFICGVATFAYFAMLSGQGWTAIAGCRQFFYARYVDWMITTSLLILDLGLVAGQDFVTIAAVIGADSELMLSRDVGLSSCSHSFVYSIQIRKD
jgi:bacteriorhodopsin